MRKRFLGWNCPRSAPSATEAPEGLDVGARVDVLAGKIRVNHMPLAKYARTDRALAPLAGEVEPLAAAACVHEETDAVGIARAVRLKLGGVIRPWC